MEEFTQLFHKLLAFVYECFDRIVIHGYLSGLSRPEQVVYFVRQVLGVPVVSKEVLPRASLCFDIGHARQVDPTMSEAAAILQRYSARLRQLHVSEVNSQSKHDSLSFESILAFRRVSHLVFECLASSILSHQRQLFFPIDDQF